jgi:hypothetical protein
MFDDVAALFRENVVETFENYLDTKRSERAGKSRDLQSALSAATAMYHFREHLPKTYSKSWANIVRLCPDYSLLGDVVNAAKHGALTRGRPQLDSADQIEERLQITEYQDDRGVYRHIEKSVILKLTSGVERDLLEILINVINFWQSELAAIGVFASRPPYKLTKETQPKARADCNNGRMDLEMIKGIRFKQSYQFLRYDYATGAIVPVDLTGSGIEFRVFKPKYEVAISLGKQSTGDRLNRTIVISEEEGQKVLEFKSDKERHQFLASLPQTKEAIHQLEEEARRIDNQAAIQHPVEGTAQQTM